jgi:4-amino-4-deoxy-L-arabinose transferase-like glycosyltransferase
LLGVVALLAYQRTSRRSLLFVSAACGSLALLTRYAGIPIVATTAIALLCFGRHSARRRIADVVVYVALALVPVVLWLMRNVSASGTATNRTISWQSIKTAHWAEASEALTSWLFIPTTWLHPIVTGMILLGAAVTALSVVIADARASVKSAPGSGGETQAGVASLVGLFAVLYVGFLCVSIMLFDHGTPPRSAGSCRLRCSRGDPAARDNLAHVSLFGP